MIVYVCALEDEPFDSNDLMALERLNTFLERHGACLGYRRVGRLANISNRKKVDPLFLHVSTCFLPVFDDYDNVHVKPPPVLGPPKFSTKNKQKKKIKTTISEINSKFSK